MSNSKVKLKLRPTLKPFSDITNFQKKTKSKISTKNNRPNSELKQGNKAFTSDFINQQKIYFLSIKESQIFSLASAIKLKIEKVKCRYNLIKCKIVKIQEKKQNLKIRSNTPVLENNLKVFDFSPISFCESHSSTPTLFYQLKSIEITESRHSISKTLNRNDLLEKIRLIDQKSFRIIEEEYFTKERNKILSENKQDLIIKFGKLCDKKIELVKQRLPIDQLTQKNKLLANILIELREKYSKFSKNKQKYRLKSNITEIKPAEIESINQKLNQKRLIIKDMEKNLEIRLKSINDKELYLKDIIDIKFQIFKKIENMKRFDSKFGRTKESVKKALNCISKIQSPSDS